MIYILISILLSSFLVILFKVFERYRINASQAIIFNYFSAALCGIVLSPQSFTGLRFVQEPWFPYTLLFGLTFISAFNLVGYAVTKVGLTPVSVAQKMSMVIPVGFTIWYFGESLGIIKIAGIVLALLAVWFSSRKKEDKHSHTPVKHAWVYPFLIFLGSGLVDTAIKYTQEEYARTAELNLLLTCIFGAAGCAGLLSLLFKRTAFEWKNMLGGICLGLFNFSSTWFLMKALSLDHIESSVVFPINNIGVIIFTAGVAWLLFNEKINRVNQLGIIIAILSILLISFS